MSALKNRPILIVTHTAIAQDLSSLDAFKGYMTLALDGAADQLRQYGHIPDVIIGDLDSIRDVSYWQKKTTLIPDLDPNLTDLQKALVYCIGQRCLSISILTDLSDRLDHSFSQICNLKRFYHSSIPIYLTNGIQTMQFVKSATFSYQGELGSNCGFFGFPQALLSTQGLYYDVKEYHLTMGEIESTSNSLKEPEAIIRIQGEALLTYASSIEVTRVELLSH